MVLTGDIITDSLQVYTVCILTDYTNGIPQVPTNGRLAGYLLGYSYKTTLISLILRVFFKTHSV